MMKVRAFYHRWEIACWKCSDMTPVLWALRPPTNEMEMEFDPAWLGAYEVNPDQDHAMGRALSEKVEWFRSGHSYTMKDETYACFCVHCDSLQGNWYVERDLIEQRVNGAEPEFSGVIDYHTEHDAVAFLHGE